MSNQNIWLLSEPLFLVQDQKQQETGKLVHMSDWKLASAIGLSSKLKLLIGFEILGAGKKGEKKRKKVACFCLEP